MKITNELGLPEAIVEAVRNDPYNPGASDISVTRLIAPPQKVSIEAEHREEIVEDASERIWSLLGQAIHSILERSEHHAMAEERLAIERCGWVVSGQFDRLVVSDGILQDYKVTSVWSVKDEPKEEWEQQLNCLAHIAREHGYKINRLEIVAILRDWSKNKAKAGGDYPRHNVVKIQIPMWSEDEAEYFIQSRVLAHQSARAGTITPCSAAERWARSDVWALMKEGRKTAVKLYLSENEAGSACADAGAKHYVQFRPGESVRCSSYCNAAPWCKQWQAMQPEKPADVPVEATPEAA